MLWPFKAKPLVARFGVNAETTTVLGALALQGQARDDQALAVARFRVNAETTAVVGALVDWGRARGSLPVCESRLFCVNIARDVSRAAVPRCVHTLLGAFTLPDLISFDIDGTLEAGDPPGVIGMDVVRTAQQLGYVVGSCSDRPISSQNRIWDEHSIKVDFIVLKQNLSDVMARFKAEKYFHVGDSEVDQFFANQAGFQFIAAEVDAWRLALPDLPL